jgi:20S proteasome subunit alpha 7
MIRKKTLLKITILNSIYTVHDSVKDKEFELELSWVCEESKNLHSFVPKELADEVERLAKVAIEDDMDQDD